MILPTPTLYPTKYSFTNQEQLPDNSKKLTKLKESLSSRTKL